MCICMCISMYIHSLKTAGWRLLSRVRTPPGQLNRTVRVKPAGQVTKSPRKLKDYPMVMSSHWGFNGT